ncbi:hypothetical protein EYZ49_17310 [Salmonella enterica subsp. salamae serovar 13,22:z:-]|uniref:hypothetical protein n=1 Tax=Salmonella enterica TaxID=28901 RepID=UPI0010353D8F|nr:hypothetical protein [Salmonella enterica]TBN97366.1 hypothetical protein EYZ49_17310 [Salmonella enterica subsp. salamae serovar 13,22:z:-]
MSDIIISLNVSFAVAMAAFSHMANAATASTDTMITATVKSPTKSFLAKMLYNGYENQPWINNGPGGIMGPLPERVFFYIKVHDQTVITPRIYSDVINVTVLNQ